MIKLGFKTLFYLFGMELNKLDINFSLYSIIEKNRGALGIASPFLTRLSQHGASKIMANML